MLASCWLSGFNPAKEKNTWLATQIDRAGAAMLNRTLCNSLRCRVSQSEMIRPSNATVRVPAEGPNNRTDVKTNVSETESEAGIEGSFTVADPLITVRAASTNH